MSEAVYRDVQAAMELLRKQKYNEAIEKLSKIADKGTDYEKAVVNYNLGFAYSSKERSCERGEGLREGAVDQRSATVATRAAAVQPGPAVHRHRPVRRRHQDAAGLHCECLRHCPGRSAHLSWRMRCRERKRYEEALPQIDLALSKAKEPKELWLQMKLAISFEMKDYKGCADALVQLIGLVPAEAGLLEAAVEHVLRDEAGRRVGRGAGAGRTTGLRAEAERDQESVQRVHGAWSCRSKRAADAGCDRQEPKCRPMRRTWSRLPMRGSMRANRARRNGAEEARRHVGEGRLLLQARRDVWRR